MILRNIFLVLFIFFLFYSKLLAQPSLVIPIVAGKSEKDKMTRKDVYHKRISLNFQDIEVRSALQLLAEFAGINIVVSDTVAGNITISLNDIPWDQALNIILTTRSLEKKRMGNIIFIAPATEITERRKKIEEAQLKLNDMTPLQSELFQINYAKASEIANILQAKNETLLSTRGKMAIDARTNTLWIQESTRRLAVIRKLIEYFDVPVKQVLIEARIVNVTKDFAQDLGLHFGLSRGRLSDARKDNITQLTEKTASPSATPLADRLNFDIGNIPIGTSTASLGIALAKLGDGILLDLELSALESEGRGEVISSPRLIATNQQPAVIESGEEIPYQEATSSGATAVSFKKAVLSLKVTPQITPDGKILMDLKINQDIPTPKVFNGVPTILTKEIQTNVLACNGQTIVLGGIYKQDKNNEINRVPFLGELPMVGGLFRNQSTSIRNEELLIFITPRIISNNLRQKPLRRQRQKTKERL
ncbi:type IV pilus assembly protein PilQ [Legionella lansingensis]|uniref:Type IV pilus (Tfp) assembly protein PilQ n=1 Tax=Legionella lansingensis TaxID=45067 RepID=A0A0W0VXF5_9GAMM|nr:type IV pilus secretin PilQ [Legionella lansingensis]KTD24799.1 type IV pilus (Tfp) assembly protein PilQ [Legionella lansingensis]SNV49005.1 type IV pilus assembly protein PilQ [Legionella lansingensis]